MRCTLCGFEFDEGQARCGKCPMNKRCNLIQCPNCGYSMLRGESSLIKFAKKLFAKGKARWNRRFLTRRSS